MRFNKAWWPVGLVAVLLIIVMVFSIDSGNTNHSPRAALYVMVVATSLSIRMWNGTTQDIQKPIRSFCLEGVGMGATYLGGWNWLLGTTDGAPPLGYAALGLFMGLLTIWGMWAGRPLVLQPPKEE